MDSIQLGIHLLFVGLLLGASTTNACSPDSGDTDGDGSNEQCVDELPTDYNCTDKTCDDWADGGHCTHWWQKSPAHRHCTTSNETIMNHCKKACDNCDSETTENQNVSTTNSMNSTEMMTENVTTVAQDDGTTMSPENTTQADPCANVTCDETGNYCTGGICGCGLSPPCETNSTRPVCLNVNGTTAAGDDVTATCQCSGRLTANDTCADWDATDYARTEPLCGTDGTCGPCQANADGTGGAGTGIGGTEGTVGTCQINATFCCTDGTCSGSGMCMAP